MDIFPRGKVDVSQPYVSHPHVDNPVFVILDENVVGVQVPDAGQHAQLVTDIHAARRVTAVTGNATVDPGLCASAGFAIHVLGHDDRVGIHGLTEVEHVSHLGNTTVDSLETGLVAEALGVLNLKVVGSLVANLDDLARLTVEPCHAVETSAEVSELVRVRCTSGVEVVDVVLHVLVNVHMTIVLLRAHEHNIHLK